MQPAEQLVEGLVIQRRKVRQLGWLVTGCRAGFASGFGAFLGFACFCHVVLAI
jgi:hypothetical protein